MMEQNISKKGTASPPSDNKKLVLALSGIIFSILLAALDQTIVSTAMPRIVEELQGFSLFSWVTTAYLLTSTATIPIAGKLGDMFGRKWLLLASVILFLLGSVLSGAAPSMIWLVIFRGLQGIGAGGLQSNAFAIIGELFPDSAKRARWQGFIAAFFGVASVLGPTIGGFITDNLNWRWVFYVNLPVGLIALPTLILTLPFTPGTGRRRIDWWGAATITGAVVALLLALTWGGQKEPRGFEWFSPQIIGLLTAATILTVVFILIERKATEPVVPLKLFKIPAIRSIAAISFTLGAIMLGTTLYIPLFVQVVLGQSASGSGAIITPLSLALVTANILTGQFIGRVGFLKFPVVSGGLTTSVGVFLLTTLSVDTQPWVVTLYMIIVGFGLGQILPTMTITVQESVSRRELGVGTSTVQFFRSIGSTVGVAIVGTVVTNTYTSNINASAAVKTLPAKVVDVIQEPQNLINHEVIAGLPAQVVDTVRASLVAAIHNGFLITFGIAVVTLLVALTVPNMRVKTGRTDSKPVPATNNPGVEGLAQTGLAEGMTLGEGKPASLSGAADSGQPVSIPAVSGTRFQEDRAN